MAVVSLLPSAVQHIHTNLAFHAQAYLSAGAGTVDVGGVEGRSE